MKEKTQQLQSWTAWCGGGSLVGNQCFLEGNIQHLILVGKVLFVMNLLSPFLLCILNFTFPQLPQAYVLGDKKSFF